MELEYTVENASSAPIAEEGLPEEDIKTAQERQKVMEETEQRIILTENKRNEIEQLIYHLRDKADDRNFSEYFKGSEKQSLVRLSMSLSRKTNLKTDGMLPYPVGLFHQFAKLDR